MVLVSYTETIRVGRSDKIYFFNALFIIQGCTLEGSPPAFKNHKKLVPTFFETYLYQKSVPIFCHKRYLLLLVIIFHMRQMSVNCREQEHRPHIAHPPSNLLNMHP